MANINDMFRLSESRSQPGDFELKYYRGIFALFAIAYLLSFFIYQNSVPLREFIIPRPLFALIPASLIAASFFIRYMKQYISEIAGALFLICTLHLIGFCYINNFKTHFELAIITLILFSNLHLNRVFFVILYNVIVLSVLEYMFIAYSTSGINPLFFFLFVLGVMLICISYQMYRLRVQQTLTERERLLTSIFNQSGDAWILFDINSGMAVDANTGALSLFEIDDKNELENFIVGKLTGKEVKVAALLNSLESGELMNKEIQVKTNKDNEIWLNISFSKIPGSQNLIYCRCIDITREKKQRELSEARALETRYYLENVGEGAVVCNDEGTIKLISKNFCELLDYSQQELINGNTLFNLFDGNLIIAFADKEYVKSFQAKYRTPIGKEIWLEFFGKKIKNPLDGEKDNLWVIRNITAEKQKEILFTHPQSGFEKIFEEGHFGVIVIDKHQRIIKVNPVFADLLGYTEYELDKLSLNDLSHPDDIIRKSDELTNLHSGKISSIRKEKRFLKKNGAVLWTNFIASAITLENDSDQKVMIMIEDITAKKNIESGLKQINANVTALIESTEDAICSIDFNYEITVINIPFINKFFDQYEIRLKKGMNFKEALKGEERKKWKKQHDHAMKGEKVSEDEMVILRDGTKKYYETTLHPIFSENDLVTGVTYFSRDVTERKKVQEELLKTKEEAERATTAKSQFLATMSHEIRTPLNGLIGMLDLLKTTKLDFKQSEYVDTIQLSGEALLQIINDILDFSKIESDKMELDSFPFELKKCIEETYDILYYKAQEKNIDLLFNIDQNIPISIIGDKARLRQVFINLVGNAIKFTGKGHIIISVNKISGEDENMELQFAVKDTGVGIAPEQIERLFKAFSQAEVSTFRKYGGTGLGLAISSRLVSLMNGKIWVVSNPGEGSTFYFTIKTKSAGEINVTEIEKEKNFTYSKLERDKKTQTNNSNGEVNIITNLSQKIPIKILVAEDNMVNQTLIKILLGRLGYEPDIAGDGLQVLDKMAKEKYDLILMDVQMPELDGLEATREIVRILPPEKRPKIIAMTAFAMQSDKQKCLDAGMNDYISKPIKIEEIQQKIEKWGREKPIVSFSKDEEENSIVELLDQKAVKRLEFLGGEDDHLFLSQVVSMFLKQGPTVIEEILENEKNGDIEKMWQAAHKLKGSCLNIGATALADVSRQIEIKGRNSELKDIGKLTSQLNDLFLQTESKMKKLIR